MITLIAYVLAVIANLMGANSAQPVVVIPAMPQYAPTEYVETCLCDECCYSEAYYEYVSEFTALFNSYETKRARNGALMIRVGTSGSFKFAKKG
jgi:hypothetical protein